MNPNFLLNNNINNLYINIKKRILQQIEYDIDKKPKFKEIVNKLLIKISKKEISDLDELNRLALESICPFLISKIQNKKSSVSFLKDNNISNRSFVSKPISSLRNVESFKNNNSNKVNSSEIKELDSFNSQDNFFDYNNNNNNNNNNYSLDNNREPDIKEHLSNPEEHIANFKEGFSNYSHENDNIIDNQNNNEYTINEQFSTENNENPTSSNLDDQFKEKFTNQNNININSQTIQNENTVEKFVQDSNHINDSNIQNKNLIENVQNPNVVENVQNPNVVENFQNPNVVENFQNPNVVENVQNPNGVENVQNPNVVENFQVAPVLSTNETTLILKEMLDEIKKQNAKLEAHTTILNSHTEIINNHKTEYINNNKTQYKFIENLSLRYTPYTQNKIFIDLCLHDESDKPALEYFGENKNFTEYAIELTDNPVIFNKAELYLEDFFIDSFKAKIFKKGEGVNPASMEDVVLEEFQHFIIKFHGINMSNIYTNNKRYKGGHIIIPNDHYGFNENTEGTNQTSEVTYGEGENTTSRVPNDTDKLKDQKILHYKPKSFFIGTILNHKKFPKNFKISLTGVKNHAAAVSAGGGYQELPLMAISNTSRCSFNLIVKNQSSSIAKDLSI